PRAFRCRSRVSPSDDVAALVAALRSRRSMRSARWRMACQAAWSKSSSRCDPTTNCTRSTRAGLMSIRIMAPLPPWGNGSPKGQGGRRGDGVAVRLWRGAFRSAWVYRVGQAEDTYFCVTFASKYFTPTHCYFVTGGFQGSTEAHGLNPTVQL